MSRLVRRNINRLFLAEWVLCVGLLLSLGAYIGYAKYLDHELIASSEQERLSNQARVIEKNLASQLVSTNRALEGLLNDLAGDTAHHLQGRVLNERLKLMADILTGMSPLLITDASGRVTHASIDRLVGFDASRRDYFQAALRQRSKTTLHVSPPFVSSLGSPAMVLVRDISDVHGEFAGVLLAVLDPTFFAVLLDSVRFTPDTHIALVHGDGQLFMRVPDTFGKFDPDLAQLGSHFRQHKSNAWVASTFLGVADSTGEVRLVALRTVQPPQLAMDKALMVVVSRDVSAIYANWRRETTLLSGAFGGVTLAVFLALYIHQRRQRVFDDLTQQRDMALRDSDARLQSIFEATPDALLISDEHGTITMVNQQVTPLLGYSMAELLGKSIEDLVPMPSRVNHQRLRDGFGAISKMSPRAIRKSVKALRKDGSECHVEINLCRIETGEGLFFASALRDISERILAKERLLASETHLRTIIDNEPDCIKLVDANGILIDINAAGLAMLEADTREQVVGRSVLEFVAIEFRAAFADLHRRVVLGERVELTFKTIGLKGGQRWLETRAVPMQDHGFSVQLAVTRDITERKAADERIRVLAFYDQLTGLPNRTLLLDRLKQMIGISHRNGIFGAMLFIDLDHFKTLNDTLGHDVGDMQLKQVALRLANCVRESDTVARVGGDEFVVILSGLSQNEIEAATDTEEVATKILAALNQPYQLGAVSHSGSASIGATMFQGQSTSIDDLMRQADLAMYRAKDAGRNGVHFFDPAMETVVVNRVALEKDLRHAVTAGQFELHYQAQIVGLGRVTGAEVLVRWHHPTRGLVSPSDFIPLAEETGLILPLGHWVLETACYQLEKWQHMPGLKYLTLAVNVSALQLAQPDFVEQVMAVVERTGANPRRLLISQ
jgi:diguanylate cyclase (GGDEF)-like protein/PAS domain S-box-containing protein